MKLRLIACAFAAMSAAACDETFTPLAPATVGFSIFGYLDASADTQWIRVMPIRPQLLTAPDSFGAVVTLEHLGTGQVIELRDSVFRFAGATHPELGSEGVYVHNFWTTERIEPGASYRFTAFHEGHEPAEAIVRIPSDYDMEVRVSQSRLAGDMFRIEGLKHAAFISTMAHYYDACGTGVHTIAFKVGRPDGDVHMIPMRKDPTPPRGQCGTPVVKRMEIRTAGSQVAWPAGSWQSPSDIGVPVEASNISNSIGFIGGVLTKRVPYETCTLTGASPAPAYCVLRYDSASAALSGTAREIRCGDGPLDEATVVLSDLNLGPSGYRRVREYKTTRDGEFEIAALQPGVPYVLRVRAKPDRDPVWGETDIYSLHYDTLTFSPGERRRYDVGLIRYTFCEQVPK